MGDSLFGSKDSAQEFNYSIKDYEYDGRHGNWREEQDNNAAGKKHAEGQQNAEDRS